jgi:hypothetical protein
MDPISEAVMRALGAAKLGAPVVRGTLPANPAYGPIPQPGRPAMGAYLPSPMPTAPVDPLLLAGAYDDPGNGGYMSAPSAAPAPAAVAPTGGAAPAPRAPSMGLLAPPQPALPAPQPLSPLFGAPQAVSPLVGGGALPPIPAGGLAAAPAEGDGFLSWLGQPEVAGSLMEMGARMLAASAPSTDPRSGSLGYALGEGVSGFSGGLESARDNRAAEQDRAMNAAYKAAMIEELMRPPQVETPSLQTTFDAEGREVRGYLDPAGNFIQVGGAKAAPGKGAGGASGGVGSPTTLSGSLTTKDKQIINAIAPLRGAVDAYEDALDSTPVNWGDRLAAGLGFAGPEAVKLEALRTQVIMQLKELQGLGAPQAGDLKLLEAQLSDPASIWSLGRGPEGFKEQLNAIRALADTIANSYGVGGGGLPTAGTAPSGPPLITTDEEFDALPSGAEFVDESGNVYRKP